MNSNQKTVVIADDDIQLLRALKIRLEAEGYMVHAVQDAYQALHIACEHRPDVILLDVNMPAGDGFSVQYRMQKMPELALIPVIYVTGDRSETVERNARKMGAFAVIHKPFDTDHLIKTVNSAVSSDYEETMEQAA